MSYFNDTPVRVLASRAIAGEGCTLVEWPNMDRSWLATGEVREAPRSLGWSNYPTWAVNLWLATDERLYVLARKAVAYAMKHGGTEHDVAAALERLVDGFDGRGPGAAATVDLFTWARPYVGWGEIARAWMRD